MEFEAGETVVCVNDRVDCYAKDAASDTRKADELTYGKKYEVIKHLGLDLQVLIVNDNGREAYYMPTRFAKVRAVPAVIESFY